MIKEREPDFNFEDSSNPTDKYVITAARQYETRTLATTEIIDKFSGKAANSTYDRPRQDNAAAETLLDQLVNGGLTYARLGLENKAKLYRYLYKYNPYIARTIDLHTLLPLSSLRLQKPPHAPNNLCKDYVNNFYDRMIDASNFHGTMIKAVQNYNLYGKVEILVMDDYQWTKDTNIDDTDLSAITKKEKDIHKDKEREQEVSEIILKYDRDNNKVRWKDREKVLKAYGFDINTKYTGIRKMIILNPVMIQSIERNEEIDYSIYKIYRPKNIDKAYERFLKMKNVRNTGYSKSKEQMQRLADIKEQFIRAMIQAGYTESYVRIMLDTQGKDTFEVDTNPYNKLGMYVATMYRDVDDKDDSSVVNRILESAIDYTISRKRDREKANMSYKQNRLFTIKDGGPKQTLELQNSITTASASSQGYDIITNLDVGFQDLSLDVKDRMDFQELKANAQQDIMVGLGMTDSLLSGGESYSGAFLKVELLTTEYQAFRNTFSRFLHEKLLKPTSVKRAFVTKDDWGNNIVITPQVKFDRMSIARGTEDFNMIIQLVQSKMLPVKSILTQLGFDYEEVQNDILKETTSVFNQNLDMASGAAAQQLATTLAKDKTYLDRIRQAWKLGKEFKEKAPMDIARAMGMEPDEYLTPTKLQELVQSGQVKPEMFEQLAQMGVITESQLEQVQQMIQEMMGQMQ